MKRIAAVLGCINIIAMLGLAPSAHAGADEKIAAEELFDEGKRLMTDGKFGPACEKLEQSEHIDPAVGTLLYLGECYEKSGRPASAWATFREASSAARAAGQQERARIGQERAARLEPTLVRMVVNVPAEDAAIAGFTLKRGTEMVPQALWGGSVPVDPGDYVIEASAPGYDSFSRRVTVGKDSVTVEIPPLHAAPASAVAPTPPPPVAGAAPAPTASPAALQGGASPPPEADMGTSLSTMQIAGLVVAGAGVVSLGVGTVFGVNAISKNDDSKKLCTGNTCIDPRGASLSRDAGSDAVVANVTITLGAAALVGGGLMYFLSPPDRAKTGALRIIPAVSTREVGAFAQGSF